jgi:glycosyltransferase involved in cell wall biosynthesis
VGFIPFQQDAAPVYRALDVVVHASTRPEPFGLVIAEAMASGRPVIAVRAGGAVEIISPEQDALGVRPDDPEELAAAILRLAQDADLRARLATQARQTAEARFPRKRLGMELLAIYERLMSTNQ